MIDWSHLGPLFDLILFACDDAELRVGKEVIEKSVHGRNPCVVVDIVFMNKTTGFDLMFSSSQLCDDIDRFGIPQVAQGITERLKEGS